MAPQRKAPSKTTPKAASPTRSKRKSTTASDAIDAQLARYRGMRDFNITKEPSGKPKAAKATKTTKSIKPATSSKAADKTLLPLKPHLPFVIQKHSASHLHYDFRLGWNGVLKSWAVAKGPSYLPADKRLAVQVEDHPMEYGGFEGIIPKGQYGGGTVMLWDQGTWNPQPGHADVDEGLRTGSLKFTLHGTKMKGNWALVRMGGRAANERKPNWLLIKEHDDFERTNKDKPITEVEPNSVVTGRSLEDIARNEDHVWNSKQTAKGNAWYRQDNAADNKSPTAKDSQKGKSAAPRSSSSTPRLNGTPKEKLPAFLPPQLALQSTTPPSGSGWLHELKLDGYRIQARKDGDQIQLLTRTGLDWTHRMKSVAAQLKAFPAETTIIDGELVVLAENGTTSFADLQAAFQEGVKKPLTYFAFDLLHLNGHNLRSLPLVERKKYLAQLLEGAGEFVRFSEHIESDGKEVFHKACEFHAEGIISKRADSRYSADRTGDWLKLKCVHEQEFVIGGFTLPSKGHTGIHGIGSLLLGYYQNDKLIYAGRTGTGFTQKTHRILRDQLDKLRQPACAFEKPPAEARRNAIWVNPQLVAQVNFSTWTADNLVRQASFKGLREDKAAREIHREDPSTSPRPRVSKGASHAANTSLAAKTATRKTSTTEAHSSSSPTTKSSTNRKRAESAPIRLTHADKILDTETHLTKQQLADYYWAVAPYMLPHIAGRPLSLVRCPEGSEKPCFYQKHANNMLPSGIESIDVPDKKTGRPEPYITLSTPEALAGLAQMGVLEVHPWGSRNDDIEHPDRIVVDLDPDISIPWATLTSSAGEVRKQLKKLGLESFLKSTGGKGLHVVVPIQAKYDWSIIKQFVHAFALQMEKTAPQLYLTKMSKAARKNRIFIDYLRNERGATAVAPYSPRARIGVAVSLPLRWTDLKLSERPIFQVATFDEWRSRLNHDPWKQLPEIRQAITPEILTAFKITPPSKD
jgi:bifunctional non-homologous end joining protein LigD